jgi:hypothetical protein
MERVAKGQDLAVKPKWMKKEQKKANHQAGGPPGGDPKSESHSGGRIFNELMECRFQTLDRSIDGFSVSSCPLSRGIGNLRSEPAKRLIGPLE